MPWLVTTGASILNVPPFVLALLWLSIALGRRIQRWLGVGSCGSPGESGVVAR
jgi:hypothetical protein